TAIALVRGALPPQEWPSDRGEVEVAGGRAVAGPYPDGRWVVAWFNEPGDRCDQYTMVFYPPVSPAEVEETLANLERPPGCERSSESAPDHRPGRLDEPPRVRRRSGTARRSRPPSPGPPRCRGAGRSSWPDHLPPPGVPPGSGWQSGPEWGRRRGWR